MLLTILLTAKRPNVCSVVAVLSRRTAEIQETSVDYLDYSDAFCLLLSHIFSCYVVFAVDTKYTNTRTRQPAC